MPDDIERKLSRFREDVGNARAQLNKLEGEKSSIMRRLKDEYGLDTKEKVEKRLKELEKTIADLESRLKTTVAEIEEKYYDLG